MSLTSNLCTLARLDISLLIFICVQIDALEVELEEVCHRAAQFEEEAAEESQGMDVQLMDSQVGRAEGCNHTYLYPCVFGYNQRRFEANN